MNGFPASSDNFPDTLISFIHLRGLRWKNYIFVLGSLDLSTASGYLPASMKIKIPISNRTEIIKRAREYRQTAKN